MHDRVLVARYQLIEQLGQGGMGSVWRALDLTLKTQVAIKLIDPAIAESPEILERFQREALAAAELRSTHIVQVIDYGIDAGVPFIAMELLEGESLAARIDRLGKLTLDDTASILSQVARALARAHEKGIVHRDLKPDNIFIVREGDDEIVKVLDFGIAKKLDALSLSGTTKTRTGALLGTPYYMSPEQALGRSSIDHRTDIWSMGVIAYECLTGIRPFDSESVGALLMSICHEPLPTPSSVAALNVGFDAWFARTAAREPGARFQTALDAAAALRAIGNAPPVVTALAVVTHAVPTHAIQLRDDPIAMLETISTASVTIPGRNRRKARTTKAGWLWCALGLAALCALVLWQQSSSAARTAATTVAAPVTAAERTDLLPAAASPSAAVATHAQASNAGNPPNAAAAAQQSSAPVDSIANAPLVAKRPPARATDKPNPMVKDTRRTPLRRRENHAGF